MASPKNFQSLMASSYEASHVLSWIKPFLLAVLVSMVAQRLFLTGWYVSAMTENAYLIHQSVAAVLKTVVFTGVFCWFAPQGAKDRDKVLTEIFVVLSWYMGIAFVLQGVLYYNVENLVTGSVAPTILGIAAAWGTLYAYRQVSGKKA